MIFAGFFISRVTRSQGFRDGSQVVYKKNGEGEEEGWELRMNKNKKERKKRRGYLLTKLLY